MAPVTHLARAVTRAAVLGVATTVTLTACGDPPRGTLSDPLDSTSATPSASAARTGTPIDPSPAGPPEPATASGSQGPAGPDPALSGTRKVVVVPVPSSESILALDGRGRVDLTDGDPEFGLFVFTPVGDKYLIRTAKAGAGGETRCMRIQLNSTASLTVTATPCDTGDGDQLFTVRASDRDGQGRPTYAISNQSAFLQVSSRGRLIAEELGGPVLRTRFRLVDNGKAALPALD